MFVQPLGHSWPSVHWWLTLTAADQGAWIAGIGALAAAAAAVFIAGWEGRRRHRERESRGRLVAAYLYTPFVRIHGYLREMERLAYSYSAILPGNATLDVADDARKLKLSCDDISSSLGTFSISDAAYLPDSVGSKLAIAVSEVAMLVGGLGKSVELYLLADEHDHVTRFDAAHEQAGYSAWAAHAAEQVRSFLAYCEKEFDVVLRPQALGAARP